MCAIRLARAPSVWLAHAPSGMCALRLACTRSSWLVRLPLDPRALPWACVPSNPLGLERPHFGPRALPWAHARSLWKPQILQGKRHVRAPLGMCAICLTRAPSVWLAHALSGKCPLRLACTRSSWLLCLPIGLRVLPWARVPSDSHARTPLGLTALGLARPRYLGHVRAALRMRVLHLETPNFARKPQILYGGTQIFDRKPLFNPRKHKFSLGNVHPPFWHARERHPFGTGALRSACTRYLGHVRPTFGMHSLTPACAPSTWPARAPSGMRSHRLACVHPLGLERPRFVPRALPWARGHSVWHACAPFGNPKFCTETPNSLWKIPNLRLVTPNYSKKT